MGHPLEGPEQPRGARSRGGARDNSAQGSLFLKLAKHQNCKELSGGVAASILKRNICQAKTTSAELKVRLFCKIQEIFSNNAKHVVVTLKWLDFLAADKHPGSAENFALRLFKRDYANYFTTDEDTTTTSAAAQRRSCCEDQGSLF